MTRDSIDVPLSDASRTALDKLRELKGMPPEDLVNRAIQCYELFESEIADGGVLLVRRADGRQYVIEVLD